jgi:glutamyl-tRNA reductase
MLLGEPQILTQVRGAYREAQQEHAAGPALDALFRGAIRAGRRARAETAIGSSPAGFVEAGASLAERALGGLEGRSVAVVGAGEMARLTLRHLRDRGVGHVRVLNRSVERAARLAATDGAEPRGLDAISDVLALADLVVSSTGASGIVIGADVVRRAMAARRTRPLFLLDLAVPRDVDPSAGGMAGVTLVAIDHLREALASRTAPAAEIDRARAIVSEEVERFTSWRRAARLAPLIRALRERGDGVAAAELARVLPRLEGLDERERAAVESLAQGIVAKLIHDPIVRLRRPGSSDALARALGELFGIEFTPGA